MLEQFESITGQSAGYVYGGIAFIFGLLLAYLMWYSLVGAWARFQNNEMDQADVLSLLARALILFLFFFWLITRG